MYEVIHYFTDSEDGYTAYHTGDAFPREGVSVSDARIDELSGKNNKLGIPLIKKIGAKTEPKTEPKEDAPGERKPRKARKKG